MKVRILLIAGIIGLVTLPLLAETILTFQPGERKNVWLEVEERDGLDFTLQTGTYWVAQGTAYTEQTAAVTISGKRMYCDVNASGWTEGSEYRLWTRWMVETAADAEIYMNIVRITCGEEWE